MKSSSCVTPIIGCKIAIDIGIIKIEICNFASQGRMLDWNDLRYVQALTDARNVAEAALKLGVHQSTVFRRLNAIEKELGVRLFERFPSGYVLTAAGEEFYQTAKRIEEDIVALNRRISRQDMRPSGIVRVAIADSLLVLLTPCFVAFRQAYPEIELDVSISSQTVDLTKRDADVAIRLTNRPLETLVGRRIARVAAAIYGSKTYLAKHPTFDDLSHHQWITSNDSSVDLAITRWLEQSFPGISFHYRINTCMGRLLAVKQNLGLAVLWCFMTNDEPNLQQVHPPVSEFEIDMWILTHEDLRYVARIRAFIDFIASRLSAQEDLLEGHRQ